MDNIDYQALAMELIQKMHIINRARPHRTFHECMQGEPFILQYLLLHEGTALPSEISQYMCISTARIAVALNSLERKGLITRRIDTCDRRKILVDLTREGQLQADYQKKHLLDHFIRMISLLGEQDAREYLRIISKIADLSTQNKDDI